MEKLTNISTMQVVSMNITVISYFGSVQLGYHVTGMAITSAVFFPEWHYSNLSTTKASDKFQLRNTLRKEVDQ